MKTLYLLLLLVVIIIGVLIYQKMASVEGFADTDTDQVELNSCPHNMQSYVDPKTSDTVCCDGTVQDNICSGDAVCTLTPTSASNIPACSTYIKEYNGRMAKEHCFDTMSQYYEDDSQTPHISGCAQKVNKHTSAPTFNAKSCRIYSAIKMNQYKHDSCENQKMKYLAEKSSFCTISKCTNVNIGGHDGTNIPWINAFFMTQNGSTPVQGACESKESVIRHLKYGYGDEHVNEPWAQPKTGQELADALAQVEAGTYPGMCPISPSYTPMTVPLEKLQEMFEKAGCTHQLTEGDAGWWRKTTNLNDIQNDMNAYGNLTKGCTGSKGQHEFCSPGKCPISPSYTPTTVPLEKLQEMFEKAGCTRQLIEGDAGWWRKTTSLDDIQNDMNAYGNLTKGCTGSKKQHEFCSPGKCS